MLLDRWHESLSGQGCVNTLSTLFEADGDGRNLVERLSVLADELGYPVVLRTAQGVLRQKWSTACLVENEADFSERIKNYRYWAAREGVRDIVWAVQKMVRATPLFKAFDGMPVWTEGRVFANNGTVQCFHPRWLASSLRSVAPSSPTWLELLIQSYWPVVQGDDMRWQAEQASKILGGFMAMDFVRDTAGKWYLFDVDSGETAWHWETCLFNPQAKLTFPSQAASRLNYRVDTGACGNSTAVKKKRR